MSKASQVTRKLSTAPSSKQARKRATAGRPTAERVEAINKAILTVAREHFLALGFENTPIDEIAATAKVSKRTLYARYPTKDALRIAVIIEELNRLSAKYDNQLGPRAGGLKEILRRQAHGIMTSLTSPDVRALDRLIGDTTQMPRELAKVLVERQASVVDVLTNEIVEAARMQHIPPSDPARVAGHMMARYLGGT